MYMGIPECPWRIGEAIGSPESGFTDGCEPSQMGAGNWTLVLEEEQGLLTAKTSFQPRFFFSKCSIPEETFFCL